MEMEKVGLRVRESMIVVAEKQKYVQRLRSEKENAEKYIELNEKLKTHKASLIKKRFETAAEKIEGIEKEIKDRTSAMEEKSQLFEDKEKDLENREKMMKKVDEEIMQNYLGGKPVSADKIKNAIRKGTIDIAITPVRRPRSDMAW